MTYREETDFLGTKKIPINALYGINAVRAKENFPVSTPSFDIDWYKAVGTVKKACYITYKKFIDAIKRNKIDIEILPIKTIPKHILSQMIDSAAEVSNGQWYEHFIVPAIQGGAGTSINMNINEIIANRTLQKMNLPTGKYDVVHPIEHCNIYQSTNDVIPTALKIAIMQLLNKLEKEINKTRSTTEQKEHLWANIPRIAYTQLQAAVPSTYGKLFSNYNDALSRDWWRVSKTWERIKQVNLGGSAIGTGITVPTYFIMEVVNTLKHITNLPIARSENMCDTTSNLDSFVEIHAILKAHATTLHKMANDIRLLSADIGHKELNIPPRQTGSSIMPGKVNPVIIEFVISASQQIFANDSLITSLCANTDLDLNAYLPLIGHSILQSLKLLIASNTTFNTNLLQNLKIDTNKAIKNFYNTPSLSTALVPYVGYQKAGKLASYMKENNINIFEANKKLQIVDDNLLNEILKPSYLMKTGFSIKEILKFIQNEKER